MVKCRELKFIFRWFQCLLFGQWILKSFKWLVLNLSLCDKFIVCLLCYKEVKIEFIFNFQMIKFKKMKHMHGHNW